MKVICVIPCGKRKIWDNEPGLGAVPAASAYTGVFHRLCQQYARTFYEEWFILSAKHGFLKPDDLVPGNYDLTFNQGSPEEITADALKQQTREKGIGDAEKVIMVGGKKFAPVLQRAFGFQALFPLTGSKGIGDMQRKLKAAIEHDCKLEEKIHEENKN
ncbi:hypothetical protein GKZ89_20450 [Bacillus mangrovi]|uniref:DUF6884 domain-containing protein n=1 Tax=Metabacillus mangrovi TaxID=1491830 RepID=A0A7X2S9Y0_9BACI|nr:DUF6884 domain-containing protein [Metabacillus mangrovi]MTH55766.1 hypothetical protein [Metabacillus mangrovi]